MISAYNLETSEIHSRMKRRVIKALSGGGVACAEAIRERAKKLDSIVTLLPEMGVLSVLEWNFTHADLRELDSADGDVAHTLNRYMQEEIHEYEEALREYILPNLDISDNNEFSWYARDDAKERWSVASEVVDAGIFAIGLLESLGYSAQMILEMRQSDYGRFWQNTLDNDLARNAVHVLQNVNYHVGKLGMSIGAIMFYKSLLNEQHRSGTVFAKFSNNGFSSTMRRSIGSVSDSQMPPLAQSWVGPTVLETHVYKMNDYVEVYPLGVITQLLDLGVQGIDYSDLKPEPLTRQGNIELWRASK